MAGEPDPIYGSLPKGWELVSVAMLSLEGEADIQTGPFGTMLHANAYRDIGTPVVAVKNIGENRLTDEEIPRVDEKTSERLARYRLRKGDILFGRKGAVERRAYVHADQEGWLQGSDCIRLRLNGQRIIPRFVSYTLGTPQYRNWIVQNAHGATMPSLNQEIVGRIPLPLPPLKDQQAIASILGTLDDKIELNRRMNQTLEAMARAIFKSWFVDFDPVRAKAAGKTPAGLAPRIAELFPDGFEESELGEIPKGWRVGSVDEVADINARTLGRHDSLKIIDYVEISEVMRGEVARLTRYPRGGEPSRARRRLQHGDTALSTVRPDRGAYFLCLNPPDSLIASTGFAVLSSRTAHWAFLHAMVTRQEIGQELGRLADGGAYPAVRPEVIGKLPIVLPVGTEMIAAYDAIAEPLLQRAEVNRGETRALAALRDALLPKLISGELRVPDAERIVGRCL